jgi:hypothetical protein
MRPTPRAADLRQSAPEPHLHRTAFGAVQVWWWDASQCAFLGSLRGLELVPSKWRNIIPPRRIEPVEISSTPKGHIPLGKNTLPLAVLGDAPQSGTVTQTVGRLT